MKMTQYLAAGFFFAMLACIIYLKYDVRYCGIIAFILTAILGITGICLTVISVKQFRHDRQQRSSFPVAELVYIRSDAVTDNESVSYHYVYEYYVQGKRYEYTDNIPYWSKEPAENHKITRIRYNPKNPDERININKESIVQLLNGPISIVFALMLFVMILSGKPIF
jgi:hypothetical protein